MPVTSAVPWRLVPWDELDPKDQRVPASVAISTIDSWFHDPDRRQELFQVWEHLTGTRRHANGAMDWMDLRTSVRPALLRAIEVGQLVMVTDEGKRVRGGVSFEKKDDLGPGAPADSASPTKTWIEFLVQDMAGQPMSGKKYRATLTDGTTKKGETDSKGLVRFDELDPGICEFVLEGLDGSAWETGDGAGGAEGTDWIEFLVTDSENHPLGDVRYEARLTDGSFKSGTTDETGLVRFEALPGGECQFRLPDYDAEETLDAGEASDWMELLLIGGEGQPMAGVAYEAALADGSKRSGKTGDDGLARFTGLKSGKLELRFPEVDAEPEGE